MTPYSEQIIDKQKFLKSHLGIDIKIHTVDIGHLRDRCDLSLIERDGEKILGLYDIDKKIILDLEECPQMSESLWRAVSKFRADLPPITLGSVRIRVSPNGQVGIWLDLPNLTVKDLLIEKSWFERTLKWAYVEIGQKRKKLVYENGKHQLLENQFETWFETYIGKTLDPFPIYGCVGGFTQPGFRANKKLIEVIDSLLPDKKLNILELCSGSGNFSINLASLGHNVTAAEVDNSSLEAMQLSLNEFDNKKLIDIHRINIHSKSPKIKDLFVDKDLVLVDPPRSGLGRSLDAMMELKVLPKNFIYISCYPESLAQDLQKLEILGYRLTKAEAVDQFPQSKHIEVICLLEMQS